MENKSYIQHKNWTIVGTKIKNTFLYNSVYLRVICKCGSEQLRTLETVTNTVGNCNNCGVEPLHFTIVDNAKLSIKPGEIHDGLLYVEKRMMPDGKVKWLVICEKCNKEDYLGIYTRRKDCYECYGKLGEKNSRLTFIKVLQYDPSIPRSHARKILCKCDCGNTEALSFYNWRSGVKKQCDPCTRKQRGEKISLIRKSEKQKIKYLEAQIQSLMKKMENGNGSI